MTTKQYLRFEPGSVFGVIASSTAKVLHLDRNNKCNSFAVPACENVIVWNIQTKEKSLVLHGESSYVTCLIFDGNYKNIAVGYADGIIRIFDIRSGSCLVSFCGHKSAVSCLAYDEDDSNLVSGGKDSEIVVWNVTDQAGLFRLKGHRGSITKCLFVKERNALISSSMDTYVKFWDLVSLHCFYTIVDSRFAVLDFIVLKNLRLIAGINNSNLIVWDLRTTKDVVIDENMKKMRIDESGNSSMIEKTLDGEEEYVLRVGEIKTVQGKTVGLVVDKTERILGCHESTKVLQLFKILNPEEALKHLRKRKRKEDKKRETESGNENMSTVPEIIPSLADEYQSLQPIQTNGKIDSCSLTLLSEQMAKITVLLKNNSIFQYELDISNQHNIAQLCHSIAFPGHRTTIRSLNYSSDSLSILSVSDESIKLWKRYREEQVCTQTLACDSGLCSVFVSGSSHCVIGTKNGTLVIYKINSQELLETVQSHDGVVNCLCESPDQCGVASGSKDKSVKFWDFELVQDETYSTKKRLTLSLKRTLQMPEEVICLRYSPDKKKIAVALQDNNVQVLFLDSLKLVFSLHGHVLPVTCMDISYDSTLIVTGSEDKDIRIWSMEFGSCNKFIKKAHDKGITSLRFLPKTHLFFTGGKDNKVKQWDADNFQKIITLKGHQNEISSMTVSPDGVTVATASRDKSIRVWEKTQEPLVLEEEQEKESEEEIETEDLPVVPGEVNKEVALPGLKTMETIKSVEQLIEAIDIYKEEIEKLEEHEQECKKLNKELPPPTPHALLIAYSASSPILYMKKVMNKIKSSELEGTLMCLPFDYVLDFLKILLEFVERGWEIELCERCSSFLVRIHMGQIIASSQSFQPVVEKLKEKLFIEVKKLKDMVGCVRITCQLLQGAFDAVEEVPIFTSVLDGLQQKKRKSKKKLERPITVFS